MRENNSGFDFRAALESLGRALRNAGDAMSQSTSPATVWTETGLRRAILAALVDDARTGRDIIATIEATNEWGIKPTAAKVYPLLESLADENVVTASVVKDRKVYALTKAGKAEAAASAAGDGEFASATGSAPRTWAGVRSELTTASSRLAKTALDVAQHGSAEQQKAAAAAIDDARRAIHKIMSAS